MGVFAEEMQHFSDSVQLDAGFMFTYLPREGVDSDPEVAVVLLHAADEPLVSGSHLLSACLARGIRELDYLGDDFSLCFRIRRIASSTVVTCNASVHGGGLDQISPLFFLRAGGPRTMRLIQDFVAFHVPLVSGSHLSVAVAREEYVNFASSG